MQQPINIFWFRRDLRLNDNAALYHALRSENPVLPVFIFDRNILDKLENKKDSRVEFILRTIENLHRQLAALGTSLEVYYDYPENVFRSILQKYNVEKVFTNHDYEPYATERDNAVKTLLTETNVSLHTYKDQVIFEKNEIVKDNGTPYVVFTPYSKKWREKLNDFYLRAYPNEKYFSNFHQTDAAPLPTLEQMGFEKGNQEFPSEQPNHEIIKKYAKQRDYPGINGTSRLGLHLRFGTISIRGLAKIAQDESAVFLNELIWRDFYMMILWQYPKVGQGRAFKRQYENIEWRNDEKEFQAWCEGNTGYPIVDAGMRQMNSIGFIHNRVRMIVASFLAKHLLIDWRWGEAYFAEKLLDYDLAANNGGWQWAAGSGCDAAPYFRVFNPTLQTKKFDPRLEYVRKWVPEFEDFSYAKPIVEHDFARKRCLEVYSKALKQEL